MRIAALHLNAYGHFAGRSLTFGSKPGLNLIYGLNEAGKSTTLRALSSVLFGYPHEVVDGYVHDAKDIAIGADLIAQDDSTLSFVRKRRGKNALARTDGGNLDEVILQKFLGGVSKETFERVFALDHHRLHEHAQALLSEGGSLGFSLAAAGSGIVGLKAALDRLKIDRATLFLPGGSRPQLNQLIGRLTDLRREARRRTVSPAEYKKRQKEIDAVEAELRESRSKVKAIGGIVRKLERIVRNLPLRARHLALLTKLELLADVPLLAPEQAQKRIKAVTDRDAATADFASAEEAIIVLEAEIGALRCDDAALAKRIAIEALSGERAVIEKADRDLPKREAERNQLYDTVRSLLAKAELTGNPEELDHLLPSAVKRKALATLAEKGAALLVQKETAVDLISTAEEAFRLGQERLGRATKPQDTSRLSQALLAFDKLGDIGGEIAKRKRTLERKKQTLRDTIIGLGLKVGDGAVLRQLNAPAQETVSRFRLKFSELDGEAADNTAGIKRLDLEDNDLDDQINNLTSSGAVTTREDMNASRRRRDELWTDIRDMYIEKDVNAEKQGRVFAPDGDVSQVYEQRVRDADEAAEAIIAHTAEATELTLLRRQKVENEMKRMTAAASATSIQNRCDALTTEWKALWPPEILTVQRPNEMIEWLRKRDVLLREDEELQKEEVLIVDIEAKEDTSRIGLLAALQAFGESGDGESLETLRDRARKRINDLTAAATEYEKAVENFAAQQKRKAEVDAALAKIKVQKMEWSTSWAAALSAAGLKTHFTTEAAGVISEIMNNLDNLKTRIDDLTHRIETMSDDRKMFGEAVGALGSLTSDMPGLGSVETVRRLEERLNAAEKAEGDLRALKGQLEIRLKARTQADAKLRRSLTDLGALCAAAGCVEADELEEIEQKSVDKQEAMRGLDQLEMHTLADGAGLSLAELFAECEGVSRDQLPADIAAHSRESADLETNIEQSERRRGTSQSEFDALFGENQAADIYQDATNVEAEITALTNRYADLTLQEILLRQSIEAYRDRNQGPVLMRAKTLFAQLTGGAYMGLRADVNDRDEPILIAEHATRGSLEINALSDGTIDPLYLALRLAVVQEHNTKNEPLPFVADDLLLNFDNTRTQATLRILGVLATTGQVLFFTHHEHMVALARASLPADVLIEHML